MVVFMKIKPVFPKQHSNSTMSFIFRESLSYENKGNLYKAALFVIEKLEATCTSIIRKWINNNIEYSHGL